MRRDTISLLLLPTLLFLALTTALWISHADLWLADQLYRLQGNDWVLQDAWVTNAFIHDQGRNVVAVILLAVLAAIALSSVNPRLTPYRRGFCYVLTSALVTVAVVNLMKETTGVDCPWDLSRYGGENAYVPLFGQVPPGQEAGRCFPAGHASGAYCWLGLYFLARLYWPKWQWPVLAGVVGLGLIFGITQQLRGAHFVSHDIWTVYISWMSAVLCYRFVFRLPEPTSGPAGSPVRTGPSARGASDPNRA